MISPCKFYVMKIGKYSPPTLGDLNYNYWQLYLYHWKKLQMHVYMTESGNPLTYKNCIHCCSRKSTICVICNYCYSCHFMIERIENSSKHVPLKTINAKRASDTKKLRGTRFKANFIIYSMRA